RGHPAPRTRRPRGGDRPARGRRGRGAGSSEPRWPSPTSHTPFRGGPVVAPVNACSPGAARDSGTGERRGRSSEPAVPADGAEPCPSVLTSTFPPNTETAATAAPLTEVPGRTLLPGVSPLSDPRRRSFAARRPPAGRAGPGQVRETGPDAADDSSRGTDASWAASWSSRRIRKTHPPTAMTVKAHHWTA